MRRLCIQPFNCCPTEIIQTCNLLITNYNYSNRLYCLGFIFKMPRIWIDYCQFLVDQCKVTRSRHTFDRALRALPITQHSRIWPLYLKFVRKYHVPETAVRVYRRYLKVCLFPEANRALLKVPIKH